MEVPNYLNIVIITIFNKTSWKINTTDNSITFQGASLSILVLGLVMDAHVILEKIIIVTFYTSLTLYVNSLIIVFSTII